MVSERYEKLGGFGHRVIRSRYGRQWRIRAGGRAAGMATGPSMPLRQAGCRFEWGFYVLKSLANIRPAAKSTAAQAVDDIQNWRLSSGSRPP